MFTYQIRELTNPKAVHSISGQLYKKMYFSSELKSIHYNLIFIEQV